MYKVRAIEVKKYLFIITGILFLQLKKDLLFFKYPE